MKQRISAILLSAMLSAVCNAQSIGERVAPTTVGLKGNIEQRIDSMVRANISAHSFPGCQIVVMKGDKVVVDKAYGHLGYEPNSPLVTRNTLYDIASMTKATATIGGLMAAYDRGMFDINSKVSKYLHRMRNTDKSDITVRQLLYHESGLPATLNTYSLMVDTSSYQGRLIRYKYGDPYTVKLEKGVYGNKDAKLRTDILSKWRKEGYELPVAKNIWGGQAMVDVIDSAIYNAKLGKKTYLYSCLNFCILMDMEESLTGLPHDQWVAEKIFEPLGMKRTCFRPMGKFPLSEIAPTEKDGFLRKQQLHGYVHDEIAAYSGGVQGNAGLFSTAEDIARWGQMLLDGGQWQGNRVLSEQTVRLFLSSESGARRGLGFDKAYRLKAYDRMGVPRSVVGHTGFTGTCYWVDPENELVVVFLCNRINPSRDNPAFNSEAPRTALMQIVYDSLN